MVWKLLMKNIGVGDKMKSQNFRALNSEGKLIYFTIPKINLSSGVKDKNDIEIFTGDILLIKTWAFLNHKQTGEVIFEDGCFMCCEEWLGNWTDIEKIGDKFSNPELLEPEPENLLGDVTE